jgi:hypothetical protein
MRRQNGHCICRFLESVSQGGLNERERSEMTAGMWRACAWELRALSAEYMARAEVPDGGGRPLTLEPWQIPIRKSGESE